jgi:formylglycine-generating enzyme required for sulfatase activity
MAGWISLRFIADGREEQRMKKSILKSILVLFICAPGLFAGTYSFGNWRISKEGSVTDWVGNMDDTYVHSNAWIDEKEWQLNRPRRFTNKKAEVYAVCEITAERDFSLGLSLASSADVRLNSVDLSHYNKAKNIYQLNLTRGKNLLELKVPIVEKKHIKLLLTEVDLDYMFMPTDKKLVAARRAIESLGEKYPQYDSKSYLEELERLQKKNATDKEVEEFRYRALVLNNPVVDFDTILLRATKSWKFPANWQGNSVYLRKDGKEFTPKFNDEFRVLNLKSKSMETLYKGKSPKEGLMDICLDYDAEKFIYSGVDAENNTFQIYEMNIDGSRKRQLTEFIPEVDHYNGAYLPSGKIVFCSTASLQAVPCVSGKDYVGNLFEMEEDGSNMHQLTFDQENDWYPWVNDDGRVMFLRWEYTDNAHYFTRILMQMNPDGTNLRSIYGSNSFWPNTMFYAKNIPGSSSKFAAICSGHHGVSRAGELILFDTARGDFEADGVVQRIPGYGRKVEPVIVDEYMNGKYPRFMHSYPLSEDYFLVSGQLNPSEQWSIYLVDRYDNMIKLANADSHKLHEPVPVKPRKRPPVIPDRRDFSAENATLFIQDIYEGPGLKNIPRGTVKALRIFTYGYAYRLTGGHDALAIEGGWDTKRVLGTVPVEEDGSVMVNVPHSLPLSIQPLDKDGKAIQLMRSWLTTMPGERLSCVGCHEPSSMAPPGRVAMAARKAPQELTPWSKFERPYGFGFKREIQPILDRYCAGCHDASGAKPNFQDSTEDKLGQRHFSRSYQALHSYVRRPGPESDMHLLPPMEYHASTSELIQMLDKGHHGVEMDDESYQQLITWVDLNVPYHATWLEERKGDEATSEWAEKTVQSKKQFACIDDDIEWMPDTPIKRPKFIKPKRVKTKAVPVKLAGWPLTEDQVRSMASATRTIEIGDHQMIFAKIPAGKFVMGSVNGSMDEAPQTVVDIEKPFWMSVREVTNAEFREFSPSHQSGYIDQQWKDHIYPGYPANKPEMPVIRVSWQAAMAYCNWASEKTGLKVTLPTEAQWEWAARTGSDQPFFFGESGYENHANLADKSIGLLAVKGVDPKPIPEKQRTPLTDFVPRDTSFDDGRLVPDGTAQYAASPWGLYDMHGNVAEWTRSDYKPYPYSADDGRNDGDLNERKVARGGSWRDRPHRATASCRLPYETHQKVFNVGFRVIIEE